MLQIKELKNKTGCSLKDCQEALSFCKDINVAYEYLRLRSQAVARYKIKDSKRIPWQKEDYLEQAILNISQNSSVG